MERHRLLSLLTECEAKLRTSRREIDDALETLSRGLALISAESAGEKIPAEQDFDAHRDELVRMVVAALGNGSQPEPRAPSHYQLVHRADDDSYRIGRRQLGLTEMERRVLDVLWQHMPEHASRQVIHRHLYAEPGKVAEGTIDVFVSKLRQKLKLAGGGEDYLHSLRGKGWALRPERCQFDDHSEPPARERRAS